MRRFLAGMVVGLLAGGGAVAVLDKPAEPAQVAAKSPSCNDLAAQQLRAAAHTEGSVITARAKKILELMADAPADTPTLCASDVDVIDP